MKPTLDVAALLRRRVFARLLSASAVAGLVIFLAGSAGYAADDSGASGDWQRAESSVLEIPKVYKRVPAPAPAAANPTSDGSGDTQAATPPDDGTRSAKAEADDGSAEDPGANNPSGDSDGTDRAMQAAEDQGDGTDASKGDIGSAEEYQREKEMAATLGGAGTYVIPGPMMVAPMGPSYYVTPGYGYYVPAPIGPVYARPPVVAAPGPMMTTPGPMMMGPRGPVVMMRGPVRMPQAPPMVMRGPGTLNTPVRGPGMMGGTGFGGLRR